MSKEPKSELARYAFGYSDKKPSKKWWIIHIVLTAIALHSCVSFVP